MAFLLIRQGGIMNIDITNEHKKDAEVLIRGVRLGMINSSNKELKLFGIVSTQLKIEVIKIKL